MRNQAMLQELQRHLARLGCPAARTDRLLREAAEHLEDNARDGCARGLSASEAERQAVANLGEATALAECSMASVRQAHWYGRHRFLAFAVLPPIGFFVWFLSWIALSGSVDRWLHITGSGVEGVEPNLPLIKLAVRSVYYSGILVVPAFFCWLAWTRCCGWKAMLLVCGGSALHGLFQKLSVTEHQVAWGYTIGWPDWTNVSAPLLIGAIAWWVVRRGPARLRLTTPVCVAAVSLLFSGCAAHPRSQDRGWIGGEYKLAKLPSPWSSLDTAPAFPRELQSRQPAGILVTALSSNAPAFVAGIRPGDLVLKVEDQPASKLSMFRRSIDRERPGHPLAITIFRDGQILEPQVTGGREVYESWHTLSIGTPRFAELDLWPNPSFSLVAAGYKRDPRRTEIAAPETHFVRNYGHGAGDHSPAPDVFSPEGWRFWVPFLELSSWRRMLSQEAVAALSASAYGTVAARR